MTQFNVITNDKEFTKVAKEFAQGQIKANERLQALIEYGIARLPQTNDTSHLSQALNIAVSVKSLPTKAIKAYIQAHVNVKWMKTTDGTYKFKRDGKEWAIKEIEKPFWEANQVKATQAKADMVDPIAEVKALFGRLVSLQKEGKIPESREHFIAELLGPVKALLDETPAMTKAELKALTA